MKGQDWEFVSDEKREKAIDPRFQKLASLLENKQKEK